MLTESNCQSTKRRLKKNYHKEQKQQPVQTTKTKKTKYKKKIKIIQFTDSLVKNFCSFII